METKTCTKCKNTFPATLEYYFKATKGKYGITAVCKKCYGCEFGNKRLNRSFIPKTGFVFCVKCKKEIPATKYYFFRRAKDKYSPTCKECMGYKYGTYRRRNVETKVGFKKCYICNDEKEDIYFVNGTSRCKQCAREAYEKLKTDQPKFDLYLKARKQYALSSKGREAKRIASLKRKSNKRNTVHNYNQEMWLKTLQYFQNECAYCGGGENIQQDHIIPLNKKGDNTINNIIPACSNCNSHKQDRDMVEWYKETNYYNGDRLNRIKDWAKARGLG